LLTFDMVLCSDLQRSQHFGRYLHRCAGPPTTNVKAVAARQSCTGTGGCIIVEVCSLLPHTGKFGVKVSLVITHKQGLMVGARSFPGNPYDGHVLSAQLEQTSNLLQDLGRSPKQVIVDLGYRGVDADNPGVQIIHRGKYKSLSDYEKRLLKRRQAIEPLIGHMKADHRMDRCWLQGAMGDALHALSCAAGYNIRWLLRAIVRLGLSGLFYALSAGVTCLACLLHAVAAPTKATASARSTHRGPVLRLPLSSLAALG
jgi:hypothetical protein